MNIADVVAALKLPPAARVDRRIPKKLLMEHGAPTASDRRLIQDSVEEVVWLAALKPEVLGVPAYRDNVREYLEIAVVLLIPREGSRLGRLTELVHRAIPYPLVLLGEGPTPKLSLAHKRYSQAEADKVVLDGELLGVDLHDAEPDGALLTALPVSRQPHASLFALYQGWVEAVEALQVALLTGVFTLTDSAEHAQQRRQALRTSITLQDQIANLRSTAIKASQMARLVEINLQIRRLEEQLKEAMEELR